MSSQHTSDRSKVLRVSSFETSSERSQADTVDQSGGAILALVQKAADVAKGEYDRALSLAHQLSVQLRAAEDRAAELEARIKQMEANAHKAEDWLAHIHKEIESKFLGQKGMRSQPS
jgi:hypothetical protein